MSHLELKDKSQFEKAKLEDILVDILYRKYRNLVFHGGTCIWRCYSGNRFSRDIDLYYKVEKEEQKALFLTNITKFLKDRGFVVKERGYERKTNTMHVLLESFAKMKIDINFNYKVGVPTEYKKVDDSRIIVLSLSPEELLNEKIEAYNDKLTGAGGFAQPEVQDLYDIYYLLSLVDQGTGKLVKNMKVLIAQVERNPPANIKSLEHLIISGLSPSFEIMITRIREWIDDFS